MVCDIINFNNMFYFRRPEGEKCILEDDINYRAYKNLKKYFKIQQAFGIDFHDTDYFYYEVEKREKMNIGDQVYFKQKDLYINQYSAKFHQGELIYTYRLCRKKGIWQDKLDNSKLKGVSLEGKVLEVKEQLVKLHLDIDKGQNQDKAFWFTFAPPTGNVMYSMPIVGTNALLYFPNESKAHPIVIGCVRKNGSSYNKFSDVNNRYYTTEHKNQLAMVPQSISFTCSGNPGLNVTLDDEEGVTLKSDKNITLTAPNEVIMKTKTKVTITGTNKLEVQRESKQAGIYLENDMYSFSDIVHENGSNMETFGPCSQAPALQMQEMMNAKNIMSAVSGNKVLVSSIGNNGSRTDDKRLDETLMGLDEYDKSTAKDKKGTRAREKGVNGCYFPGTISESGVFMPDYEDAFWDTGYESYKEAMYDYNSRKKNPATDAQVSGYMVRNAPNMTFGLKAFGDHINNALIKPVNNVFLLQAAAGGMSPEYSQLYADFSSGMLLDVFGAVSIAGIKSTSALYKGYAFSGDVYAGSGMGNIKKFGITKDVSKPKIYDTVPNDSYAYEQYKKLLMKDDVLSNSKQIINGEKLWDQKAKDILTSDGSNVGDWWKMESKYSYETEFGKGKIHYYQNANTGKISAFDSKLKVPKPEKFRLNDKDTFWIIDLDGNFIPSKTR